MERTPRTFMCIIIHTRCRTVFPRIVPAGILLGECIAFLASGSDPTVAKYMIQLESLCSTGEAASSLSYVHMTYPQTCW